MLFFRRFDWHIFCPINKYDLNLFNKNKDFLHFVKFNTIYLIEMQQFFAATYLQRNFIGVLITSEIQKKQNYD